MEKMNGGASRRRPALASAGIKHSLLLGVGR